jgi:hypothetical protein
MCRVPQLISSPKGFVPEKHLPDDTEERLKAWDNNPGLGPAVLTETPSRRLGHYFERLYECLLENLLGWEVLLKNQPIRSNGITLGELDFIVRNPFDQVVEHHEIAVKFYLGYPGAGPVTPLWYGPNSSDRLDLKSKRLLTHQSRMTDKPETRALLHSLDIPAPARARIFMPGYLFYPAGQPMPLPEDVPTDHLRGEWLYADDVDAFRDASTRPEAALESWVPLRKPHWLGPWCQDNKPESRETEETLAMVRTAETPRLFAVLKQSLEDNLWRESSRLFVVPGHWPNL